MRNLTSRRAALVRPRCGWTLIEMLVTIAVMATMTGIAVKILTTLLRSERLGIEHVTRLATVSRLSRQFRADIHAATDLKLSADKQQPLVRITTADQRQIQYEIQPQGLFRTEQRPAQPLAAKDLLRLQGTRWRIVESPGPPRLLTLVIETPDSFAVERQQPTGAAREMHIEAIVGRDYRDH